MAVALRAQPRPLAGLLRHRHPRLGAALRRGAGDGLAEPQTEPRGSRAGARNTLDALGVAGLLVIALMIWQTDQYSSFLYRGGFVLLSIADGAGAVAALAHPACRLGPIVGWKPLRWVGVRSYGIYLWHFPIIVLTTPGGIANGAEPAARRCCRSRRSSASPRSPGATSRSRSATAPSAGSGAAPAPASGGRGGCRARAGRSPAPAPSSSSPLCRAWPGVNSASAEGKRRAGGGSDRPPARPSRRR